MRLGALELRSIPVNHRGSWMLVSAQTPGGCTGIGEASQSGNDAQVVELIAAAFNEVLVGAEVDRALDLREALRQRIEPVNGDLPRQTAFSGLEQCLWDITAQTEGVPVHAMLGKARLEHVPLYANINRAGPDRSPEAMARNARSAVAAGFGAVKCAPFDELMVGQTRSDATRAIESGIARISAIRMAIGPDTELMVDCQHRCSSTWVGEIGARLSLLGVSWLEEPLPPNEADRYETIFQEVDQRIALGEDFYDWEAYRPLSGWSDRVIFMPDVKHAGGIQGLWEISKQAEAAGVAVSFHNPSGPVATAASLHVAACAQSGLPLEFAWGETPRRPQMISPEEVVAQGALPVPNGAGLGVRPNHDWMASYGAVLWKSDTA